MGSSLALAQHQDGFVSPYLAWCHQALLHNYLQELHVEEELSWIVQGVGEGMNV